MTGIVSLPSSVGKLSNLKILDLSYAENLKSLPDAIRNLSRLEELFLDESSCPTFPSVIGNLKNLQVLTCNWCRFEISEATLADILKQCPRLVEVEYTGLSESSFSLLSLLLRNHKRSRIFFPPGTDEFTPPPRYLWPRIFEMIEQIPPPERIRINNSRSTEASTQSDLIFWLLVEHRGLIFPPQT